jgi:hypothetical protein
MTNPTEGMPTTRDSTPGPTTHDLARSIQRVEETLSEVLVLLYHVIQQHQELLRSAAVDGADERRLRSKLFGTSFHDGRDVRDV